MTGIDASEVVAALPTPAGLAAGSVTAVRLWRRALRSVEVVAVEEYLRGVVPAEMPASWPAEALRAQAVAARTYVQRAMAAPRHSSEKADLCDTAQCQAWAERTHAASDAAVRDTAGQTWSGDGAYVSWCGREGCPACEERARQHSLADVAAAGHGGHAWPRRLCQNGARSLAADGWGWPQILRYYYGGSAAGETGAADLVAAVDATGSVPNAPGTPAAASFVAAAGEYGCYPRPADDTGAGVHGGANAYHPLGDNDGNVPGMLAEMHALGLRWLKLLDVDGSSYNACRAVLAAGMMPVARLYRERPYPGRLSDKHLAVLPKLTALGVRYFERGNEPNLACEWQEGRWPQRAAAEPRLAWGDAVFDALVADWLADAAAIVAVGGYPAIDACSPGGDVDDVAFLTLWLRALKRAGLPAWMAPRTSSGDCRAWLAVHNAGLNHPPDYPDDAVNQSEHRGQTIHSHYYPAGDGARGGAPTGASDCIRKWEAVHRLAIDVAGLDLPVLCTEGGYWPGNAADGRYPALTEQVAADLQAAVLRQMATAPAYLLAQMPWLWFNRLGANRHEGFERDAWKRSPGFGNCPADAAAERPLVAALRADPCRRRGAPATVASVQRALGEAIQADVVPLIATNAFAIDGLARGWSPASDEKYKTLGDGSVYCVQVWRSAADPNTQYVVYARVVANTEWWQHRTWFDRPN